jgi:hypothetical protein
MQMPFRVSMRVPPTGISVSAAGDFNVTNAAAGTVAVTALVFNAPMSNQGVEVQPTVAAGLVAGNASSLRSANASARITVTGADL